MSIPAINDREESIKNCDNLLKLGAKFEKSSDTEYGQEEHVPKKAEAENLVGVALLKKRKC